MAIKATLRSSLAHMHDSINRLARDRLAHECRLRGRCRCGDDAKIKVLLVAEQYQTTQLRRIEPPSGEACGADRAFLAGEFLRLKEAQVGSDQTRNVGRFHVRRCLANRVEQACVHRSKVFKAVCRRESELTDLLPNIAEFRQSITGGGELSGKSASCGRGVIHVDVPKPGIEGTEAGIGTLPLRQQVVTQFRALAAQEPSGKATLALYLMDEGASVGDQFRQGPHALHRGDFGPFLLQQQTGKSQQTQYGYQQRQADPGAHADTSPHATMAGVPNIAGLSRSHSLFSILTAYQRRIRNALTAA
jgi:hypothetical protein